MVVDIGDLVKTARHEKGISQNTLAAESGIAQSTLSYIENGSKQPKLDTLSAICKGLGISVFELLEYRKSRCGESNLNEHIYKSPTSDSRSDKRL